MNHILTDDEVKAYGRDGYVTVRGLFDAKEIELLHRTAKRKRRCP